MIAQTSAPQVEPGSHRNKMDQCPECLWWSTDISKHNCPIVSPSPDSEGVEDVPAVAWMHSGHIDSYRSGDSAGMAWASPVKSDFYDLPLYATPQASAGERGWQSIETAPKDGTWILIWEIAGINTKYSPADVAHYYLGEWYNSDKQRLYGASHWQPLPAPPATLEPGRGK